MKIRPSTMEHFSPTLKLQDKAERELHAWLAEMNGEECFFRSTCRKHFPFIFTLSMASSWWLYLHSPFLSHVCSHQRFTICSSTILLPSAAMLLNQICWKNLSFFAEKLCGWRKIVKKTFSLPMRIWFKVDDENFLLGFSPFRLACEIFLTHTLKMTFTDEA